MSPAMSYAIAAGFMLLILIALMGLVRCIWWGAQLLRAKAEGHRLENEMMRRELASGAASKPAGFGGKG